VAAWPFTKQHSGIEKNLLTQDFEHLQDNEIVALDNSQEADEALTRSSKAVVQSSSTDSEDSDPMDFDNEVLEALAHLDHAQGLLLLPSARFTHSVFI